MRTTMLASLLIVGSHTFDDVYDFYRTIGFNHISKEIARLSYIMKTYTPLIGLVTQAFVREVRGLGGNSV